MIRQSREICQILLLIWSFGKTQMSLFILFTNKLKISYNIYTAYGFRIHQFTFDYLTFQIQKSAQYEINLVYWN